MSAARVPFFWSRLLVWWAGALGTAMIFHAFRFHFHDRAPWMTTGDLLVWLAFAWAVVR